MSVHGSTHPGQAPGLAHQRVSSLAVAARLAGAFSIAFLGMLVVAGWFTSSSWCWVAWLVIGAAAGAVAGSPRAVWLVALATLAIYPVAALGELPERAMEWQYWAMLTLVGGMVTGAGFALGGAVAARRGAPGRARRSSRRWVVGAVLVGLLGMLAWTGYSGYLGSDQMVLAPTTSHSCDTPASRFGWAYEPINYDPADDARLADAPGGLANCTTQGTIAGSQVLAADGTPIAGWYIPAANGAGATAPTFIVAPGWKSNKTGILKYAPFFHERFNLVLVDLRNQGRSGGEATTWGVNERQDIMAMVDWLEREKNPSWIGAVGNSMGAATVTAAAAADPRIKALVLDSMHASVTTSFGDGLANETNLPGYPTAWTMVWLSSLRSGVDLTSADPEGVIAQVGDRPVLLIHGTDDILDVPAHSADLNLAAAKAAGVPATLEYCEGGRHGKLVDHCPGQWQAWLEEFLAGIPALQAASTSGR
ncbi:MAG TPA: alpha/beta fold hydrolase [Candidatus Limnocylindrales bacterium]|nr:alpha/beta fold hydrolase [Candidatus Limnocylindrales bacterium]